MRAKNSVRALGLAAAVVLAAGTARAQVSDGVIKIGVLTDMSSLYTDLGGQGSVVAAKMAVEDFGAAAKGRMKPTQCGRRAVWRCGPTVFILAAILNGACRSMTRTL